MREAKRKHQQAQDKLRAYAGVEPPAGKVHVRRMARSRRWGNWRTSSNLCT